MSGRAAAFDLCGWGSGRSPRQLSLLTRVGPGRGPWRFGARCSLERLVATAQCGGAATESFLFLPGAAPAKSCTGLKLTLVGAYLWRPLWTARLARARFSIIRPSHETIRC